MRDIVVQSPGRTCLFGDHQDYLGLPVIACAINRHITLRATKNTKGKFCIDKPDIGEYRVIYLDSKIESVEKEDHLLAAMKILENYGCRPDTGYDISISGNIAINAGTSSSSAVIVGWIQFLLTAFGCDRPITKEFVSRLAYEAEVEFHGSPGGKMDHYSIGIGNIIYLETGNRPYYEVFHAELSGLVVAESGIPKQTTGVLGELKEKAMLAINKVKEKIPTFDIKQVSKKEFPDYANYVPDDLKVYFEAAVLNYDVTQRALLEFRKPRLDLEAIGRLMNEHHFVLKEYLKITLPLIDNMIDSALEAGALGAKIVGSGRGGSIVVLAGPGEQQKVIDAIKHAGAKDAYSVQVDPGVIINKSKE
ncbi:galactokinase [Muricauda sp. NFXS6]|uniref:mevalonate kinase family protein n=1 Tax=Allomuricauda sp. NFXS6 TaxID=2819094 RepID=UPI0032DF5BD4